MKCVTLGPKGTYSSLAAKKYGFDSIRYADSPSEVIDNVSEDVFGVLAIENSIHGTVVSTVDLLRRNDVMIWDELVLEIDHCLIGDFDEEASLIVSHPQALGQCREFLEKNYSGVETRAAESTAKATELAKEEEGVFAIAPESGATRHGLDVVEESIQDVEKNLTRFLVLSTRDQEPSGCDKSSLIFYVENEPGILYRCLGAFDKNDVNLTKLESRPSREELGDYFFFIDFKGHRKDENVESAIKELEEIAREVKLLGSYPIS